MNCKVQGPGYDYQYCQKFALQQDEYGYGIEYKHARLISKFSKLTRAYRKSIFTTCKVT
jgi:hypothetical protein